MFQTQWRSEKLLERRWYLFALFGAKEIMRNIQMGQMCGTATQQRSKKLGKKLIKNDVIHHDDFDLWFD